MTIRSIAPIFWTLRRTRRARLYAFLFFLLGGASAAATQQPTVPPPLIPGTPIEREISKDETHRYRITLTAGQFALAQVEQRGADALLAAEGPDGKEFAVVNLRTGGVGVESLAIV